MSVGEDDAEQFSLRWNNFHNNLTLGFHELLEEEDLVDVTLACDGKYVQAHKIVLSVCSPYFKSLFKENPCRHPIVILKDVGHKELQAILQFMYRGEVNVRQDDLTGFLKTAEMLKIKGLTGENSDKDSHKRALSEEKRRPRGVPSHCDDDSGSVPYKRMKSEQRRSRVVPRPSSRPHSPIECIPPSSAGREDLLHSGFDVTKPKEEPVDYSQIEDEYSSEIAPSLPHDIEEGMEEMEGECTPVEGVGGGGVGTGRNHLPAEGGGQGDPPPGSALAAMAHLVHVGGPSGSEGGQQRQESHGMESKQISSAMGLPPIGSGAVLEPNVALQVDAKERLQGVFPGSSGLSQDSSSSQDISQGMQSPNGSLPLSLSPAELRQRHLGYKCSICDKYFTRRDHLKTHTKNLHGEDLGPFACIICSQLYKNADSLRKHIGKYHVLKEKEREDV
ncbi:broad-complex core protein isoforms 1/2/3/4/5-like isoform X5 [Ischnura elegans]|uniref:broad-complex core protein isoforms 1/2/3/4/5-like isoform X5 n=1 Tax=Ischnura elegans TaxID=197161 RepID=UPI001ED884C0|nr:broad-complex core protein isoforms 1/2/3/4/5-like isoform X5 [Ischnura elegans]